MRTCWSIVSKLYEKPKWFGVTNVSRSRTDGLEKGKKSVLRTTLSLWRGFAGFCTMVGPGELTLRHAAEVEILLRLQARGLHHVNVNTAVSASPQQRPNVGLPASSPAPLVRKRLKQNFSAFSPRKDTVCTAVHTSVTSILKSRFSCGTKPQWYSPWNKRIKAYDKTFFSSTKGTENYICIFNVYILIVS